MVTSITFPHTRSAIGGILPPRVSGSSLGALVALGAVGGFLDSFDEKRRRQEENDIFTRLNKAAGEGDLVGELSRLRELDEPRGGSMLGDLMRDSIRGINGGAASPGSVARGRGRSRGASRGASGGGGGGRAMDVVEELQREVLLGQVRNELNPPEPPDPQAQEMRTIQVEQARLNLEQARREAAEADSPVAREEAQRRARLAEAQVRQAEASARTAEVTATRAESGPTPEEQERSALDLRRQRATTETAEIQVEQLRNPPNQLAGLTPEEVDRVRRMDLGLEPKATFEQRLFDQLSESQRRAYLASKFNLNVTQERKLTDEIKGRDELIQQLSQQFVEDEDGNVAVRPGKELDVRRLRAAIERMNGRIESSIGVTDPVSEGGAAPGEILPEDEERFDAALRGQPKVTRPGGEGWLVNDDVFGETAYLRGREKFIAAARGTYSKQDAGRIFDGLWHQRFLAEVGQSFQKFADPSRLPLPAAPGSGTATADGAGGTRDTPTRGTGFTGRTATNPATGVQIFERADGVWVDAAGNRISG